MRRSATVLLLTLSIACVMLSCAPRMMRPPDPDALAAQSVIRRDSFGIPHILAQSEEAAAFAFGYAQAEDHAAEIGRRYLAARGQGARHFGESALTSDVAMAQFDNLAVATAALKHIDPLYRRIISAYAAGVNRYVSLHRDRLPSWMPEVTAADVLASTRAGAANSLGGAALVRRLRQKYEGQDGGSVPQVDPLVDEAPGSNAFALAGSRTATGKPILLGNPHLQWSSLYWEAHVRVPGAIDFYGSTLVGIPVLRAGFNDRLGFVTTNNAPDLDDVFALTMDPSRPDHYLFDGRSMPLVKRDAEIQVMAGDGSMRTETRTFWSSHIGPIVYRNADRAFAVKSTRLDALEYFFGFYEMSKARSLAAWKAALRRNHVPTSNFTYADADGNILYIWNGRVPERLAGRDYSLDVEARGRADLWTRFRDVLTFPQRQNPPGGYVQNANNPPQFVSLRDPIDMSGFPPDFERGPLGLRPQLALDLIESKGQHSVQDVIDLKYSTRMLLAERIRPELIAAVRASGAAPADAIAGADVLEAWDGRVSADSRGAVLFQRFWDAYSGAVRPAFATPWAESDPVGTPRQLADGAAAIQHLAGAVKSVRAQYGSERIAWGEIHRFRAGDLDLPGEGAAGTYGTFRVMTFADPASGGEERPSQQPALNAVEGPRVRVAGHVPGRDVPIGFGDAWVLLVDFSKPGSALSILAYGQSSDAASPHSRDQLRLFAERRLRPALYHEAEIKANTSREYRPH
jgi:acyl-homoserine-lactone acylase